MAADFIKIYPQNPDPRRIAQVVDCLRRGGLVIYPTDTVYGLGCDIHNARAVERVAQVKGIKPQKADFSFICYDLSHIADYARLSNAAFKLMKKALPGPFTFVLEASNRVPKLLSAGKKTVGIRIPDNDIPRNIVRELGNPIVTTSIKNDDDFIEYPTDPEEIFELYRHHVDLIIDGGPGQTTPSTIVNATTDDFTIIRQGIGQLEF